MANLKPLFSKIKKNVYFKWALWIISALIVVFSINCRTEIIEKVYPFETELGCMLLQFANSFSDSRISDILSFFAVIMLFRYIEKNEIKYKISSTILGISFSGIYYICLSFMYYNDMILLKYALFQKILTIFCILGYGILFCAIIRVMFYVLDVSSNIENIAVITSDRLWKWGAIAIFLCWLPWILMDYPGSFSVDAINQLKAFWGEIPWTGHHPPLSTIIMGSFISFGRYFGNANFGVFLYMLTQTVMGAVIFSYSIKKALEYGAGVKQCIAGISFFALLPMWGCYAQWLEKSLIYTEIITLFTVYMADVIKKRQCSINDCVRLIIAGILTCMLRNNGIYCVIPALLVMIFFIKKADRLKSTAVVISVLVFAELFSKVIYPAAGITGGSIAEALSVPFMQTARYVVAYGGEVTEEERAAIDGVLIYDELESRYNPTLSDPVKGTYKEDASKLPAYINVWFKMFFKHPNIYFSAFINKGYGYMAPVCANVGCNMDYGEEEWISGIGVRHVFKELPIKFFDMLEQGSIKWPVIKYFSMAGLYTWLTILLAVYMVINKDYSKLVVLIPSIMTILVCFASPEANTFRYEQSVTAIMPYMLFITSQKWND